MSWKTLFSLLALAGGLTVAAVTACGDDDDDDGTGTDDDTFQADLTVGAEVPPVVSPSDASGSASFDFQASTVDYAIEVDEITGVILAHIHVGRAGVAGPIIVTLFEQAPPGTGFLDDEELVVSTFDAGDIQGIPDSPGAPPDPPISLDSLRTLMDRGETYVNVHTVLNPAGEIRGQTGG